MKLHILRSLSAALLAGMMLVSLAACGTDDTSPIETNADGTPVATVTDENGNVVTTPNTPTETNEDGTPVVPVVLTFNGTAITTSVADHGIKSEGNAFIITRGGSYELKGDLSGGQVRVAVDKTADVELILNNFTASCNNSAPLYIESANKATIVLAAGSNNTLTDAARYEFAVGEDKPNACLYSSDDLTIKGDGSLTINANYNNGIGCKNDLRIKSGTITAKAVNNIIKGNDSVEIEAATLKLSGGEDAIKADTTDRPDKGYVLIMAGAKVDIVCSDDALQAATSITVEAGATITGQAGGDLANCPGTINTEGADIQLAAATEPTA